MKTLIIAPSVGESTIPLPTQSNKKYVAETNILTAILIDAIMELLKGGVKVPH